METNQPSQRRRFLSFKLYFGSILILLGLLMMARNGNYINEDLYSALISWPMIPILLGFYTLLHRNFTSGLIFIAVGLYFLMPYFTWIGPNAVFWPYFLIGGGIAFIFIPRNKRHKEWKHSLYQEIKGIRNGNITIAHRPTIIIPAKMDI